MLSTASQPGADKLMLRISCNPTTATINHEPLNLLPVNRHIAAFSLFWRTGEPDAAATPPSP